ncbi:hypothetical protein CP061683_0968B, partial [Chlamydia psittaci 06-1683]
CDFFCF